MNSIRVTPAEILKHAHGRMTTALAEIHAILCKTGHHDVAARLSEEADLRLQELIEVRAHLHEPDAQESVLRLVMDAASTAAQLAYEKGRVAARAEGALPATATEILKQLHDALHIIAQANCSMGAVAKEVGPTTHEHGVLCPDLIMPMLIKATSEGLAKCYAVLDEIEQHSDELKEVA